MKLKLLESAFGKKKPKLRLVSSTPPSKPAQQAKDYSRTRVNPDAPTLDWETIANRFIYEAYNADRYERKQGYFHPSSGLHPSAGSCKRAIVFDLLCAPRVMHTPTAMLKIMDNGTDRHVGLGRLFRRMAEAGHMGIAEARIEEPLKHPTLPIFGNTDLILRMKNKDEYLIDFKTKGSAGCKKLKEPLEGHKAQVMTYMLLAHVGVGYILYENKDSQAWAGPAASFYVRWDQDYMEEIEEFCRDILRDVKKKRLPIFDKATCDTMMCNYESICSAEQKGLVDWDGYDKRTPEIRATHEVV